MAVLSDKTGIPQNICHVSDILAYDKLIFSEATGTLGINSSFAKEERRCQS